MRPLPANERRRGRSVCWCLLLIITQDHTIGRVKDNFAHTNSPARHDPHTTQPCARHLNLGEALFFERLDNLLFLLGRMGIRHRQPKDEDRNEKGRFHIGLNQLGDSLAR